MKTRQHKQIHPAANRRTPGQIFSFSAQMQETFGVFFIYLFFLRVFPVRSVDPDFDFDAFFQFLHTCSLCEYAVTFLNFRHALTFGGCTAPRCRGAAVPPSLCRIKKQVGVPATCVGVECSSDQRLARFKASSALAHLNKAPQKEPRTLGISTPPDSFHAGCDSVGAGPP